MKTAVHFCRIVSTSFEKYVHRIFTLRQEFVSKNCPDFLRPFTNSRRTTPHPPNFSDVLIPKNNLSRCISDPYLRWSRKVHSTKTSINCALCRTRNVGSCDYSRLTEILSDIRFAQRSAVHGQDSFAHPIRKGVLWKRSPTMMGHKFYLNLCKD